MDEKIDNLMLVAARLQEELRNSDSILAKAAKAQEEFRNSDSVLAKAASLNSVADSVASVRENSRTSDSLRSFVLSAAALQDTFKSDTFKSISDPLDACGFLHTSDTFKTFRNSAQSLHKRISDNQPLDFPAECYEFIGAASESAALIDEIADCTERADVSQNDGYLKKMLRVASSGLSALFKSIELIASFFGISFNFNTNIENHRHHHYHYHTHNDWRNDEDSEKPKASDSKSFE